MVKNIENIAREMMILTIRNFFHILSLKGMRFMCNKPHIFLREDRYEKAGRV